MNTPDQRAFASRKWALLWFLLPGIVVRLIALNQPLVDAFNIRQTQTALITKGMMEEPGLPFGAVATWRGDQPARLVLEFPLYNYLVIPVYRLTGNLDVSGKLVSVTLWALSFVLLQGIWRRCLTPRQTFWANLLFVLAPLSVFFGQAFMPEMLVQLLAFGFLVALLRYQEKPGPVRFALAAGVGLVGMLVKMPELAHLYLIAAVLVFRQEGFRALRAPVYWVALIVTLLALKGWSQVIDATNARYFPDWTSQRLLSHFVGKFAAHVDPVGYVRIGMYLTCFVLTPIGLPFALAGIWRLCRTRDLGFPAMWVLSVAFFFVLWCGPMARGQSYYNLPALAPCAMLFGLGVDWGLARFRSASWFRPAAVSLTAMLIAFLALGSLYLFRPDRVVLESTRWVREHTRPEDLILLKANHRNDTVNYPALAQFPYYARRRFWIYSPGVPPEEIARALETARYVLITLPPAKTSWIETWRRRVKRETFEPVDIRPVLEQAGFRPIYTNEQFMIFSRQSPAQD